MNALVFALKIRSFGSILNATRTAIAVQLVKELEKSNNDVSVALGITPSAVSQYVKGKRGASLRKSASDLKGFDKAVKDTAVTVAGLMEIKEYERCQGAIIKMAQDLVGFPSENETGGPPKDTHSSMEVKTILSERIKKEHDSAMYFLGFAQNTGNYFARILFRQIATDSLRHADIVQVLLERVDKPRPAEHRKIPMEIVDKLLEKAKEHKETSINEIKGRLGPEASLLIESIEMDDKEQIVLLKKFKNLMK